MEATAGSCRWVVVRVDGWCMFGRGWWSLISWLFLFMTGGQTWAVSAAQCAAWQERRDVVEASWRFSAILTCPAATACSCCRLQGVLVGLACSLCLACMFLPYSLSSMPFEWPPPLQHVPAGSTTHVIDPQLGRVVAHVERWKGDPGKVSRAEPTTQE